MATRRSDATYDDSVGKQGVVSYAPPQAAGKHPGRRLPSETPYLPATQSATTGRRKVSR